MPPKIWWPSRALLTSATVLPAPSKLTTNSLKKLGELPGVEIKLSPSFFKEFVVNFDGTGKSVAEINKALLGHQIFGGKDVSAEFPELGQSALYCVTEYYDQADIDALARAVKEVTA